MTKLEKIARRCARRAEEYRKAGDKDAYRFSMYWLGRAQRRVNRAVEAANHTPWR